MKIVNQRGAIDGGYRICTRGTSVITVMTKSWGILYRARSVVTGGRSTYMRSWSDVNLQKSRLLLFRLGYVSPGVAPPIY